MLLEILHYQTAVGRRPFEEWFWAFRDPVIRNRIKIRLNRLQFGNLGDAKAVGAGVWELRLHFGPGYRIYIGFCGSDVVILLNGGEKSGQERDIRCAKEFWEDYLRRK